MKSLRRRIDEHQTWLKTNGNEGCRFTAAVGEHLPSSYFRGADLSNADFRGADLRHSDFRDTNLQWANFKGSDLRGSNFRGADLRYSCLTRASLEDTGVTVHYLRWRCIQQPDYLTIGCQRHTYAKWASFDDYEIHTMDCFNALGFWRENKKFLLKRDTTL